MGRGKKGGDSWHLGAHWLVSQHADTLQLSSGQQEPQRHRPCHSRWMGIDRKYGTTERQREKHKGEEQGEAETRTKDKEDRQTRR